MKDPQKIFTDAVLLMDEGNFKEALALCEGLVESYPSSVNAWVLLSQLNLKVGQESHSLMCAKKAYSIDSKRPKASLQLVSCLLHSGARDEATSLLYALESQCSNDVIILKSIADLYVRCDFYEDACRCYKLILDIDINDTHSKFLYSGALVGLGCLEEAGLLLDSVLEAQPLHYEAVLSRSSLNKKTIHNDNIRELQALLTSSSCTKEGSVLIYYALAKELEDLGRYKESFASLAAGAQLNDKVIEYDVERDVESIGRFLNEYRQVLSDVNTENDLGEGVIFILGLPRVGSTLTDRILSSHSEVKSLGETSDFHYALLELSGVIQREKGVDFIDSLKFIDFEKLGRRYLNKVSARLAGESWTIVDKTPNNALYLGLIQKALPKAKIIHLYKNPMDSCYSLYKALFKKGYPFSYNLEKLAKYFVVHNNMMSFWQDCLPDDFMNLKYEDLVREQRAQTEKLLDYCGLDWQESCMNFHENSSPTATASVVQVRSPINSKAVNKWKLYSAEMKVVSDILIAAGIDID